MIEPPVLAPTVSAHRSAQSRSPPVERLDARDASLGDRVRAVFARLHHLLKIGDRDFVELERGSGVLDLVVRRRLLTRGRARGARRHAGRGRLEECASFHGLPPVPGNGTR